MIYMMSTKTPSNGVLGFAISVAILTTTRTRTERAEGVAVLVMPIFKACHCQSASTWQLLSVCRQTYFEALPVFYQLTKFSFSSPRHFWNFYVRIDKHAPLLEPCDATQGWYNSKSYSLRSKSPELSWYD